MFKISNFEFNDCTASSISQLKIGSMDVGENWPVVYIINNDEEAYIGETVHASRRVEQHLQNEDRRKLTEIQIISDDQFNKSVILDLEAFLIKHMSSDGRFMLQNGNGGLQNHNYYDKEQYEQVFIDIWNKLKEKGIVTKTIDEIENSDLFKYSPYKSLGEEQRRSLLEIAKALAEHQSRKGRTTVLVRGGAGTGKTILAIYLIKLLKDISDNKFKELEVDDLYDEDVDTVFMADNLHFIDKIGIVLPQASLQTSIKDVFKSIRGLDESMVLSPYDVVQNYKKTGVKYDLLIVDEAHRLKCRDKGHLSNYVRFDECNRILGFDKHTGNELDWILSCSKNQILFRDELQTVRPCDIDAEKFSGRIEPKGDDKFIATALSTQWRCLGGNDYIDYLKDILSCRPVEKKVISNYDVKLFLDVEKMINEIKKKNSEMGLCRVVAGYAWPWNTKPGKKKKSNGPNYDIKIHNHEYVWNKSYNNWIGSKNSINEIGCIHTVQGYDLNYAGVIIGEDIKYNKLTGQIEADKNNYFDQQGKSGVANDPEALREYLTNIYLTLLTRGIKGTYIYVCNDALREHLAQFFDQA